ncbi:MAG: ArsR/SmtB family transcription factor [Pseudoclavibacter sp.]
MADVFKAIADPTRRAILDELTERNGQSLFELCGRLAMKHGFEGSRQAVSQHLDVLEAAGLVEPRREGRYKFLFVDPSPLESIAARWLPGSIRTIADGIGPDATGDVDHPTPPSTDTTTHPDNGGTQ